MPPPDDELQLTLQTTFGYPEFRPLQREIITASLAGRDVFALLPTGGGKSMCYQLPALLRGGLTVVVSPLIALMKDQVDQLQTAGVAATFLNSTLGERDARSRLAGLHRGEWRLLYVSPERLMLEGWMDNLRAWNVSAFAIDEAHCISEWGHDFRPEYRQLAQLRGALPEVPIMALTATATERVRADIIERLKLRAPEIFVASFNRPNLTYRVLPKDGPLNQVVDFVKKRAGDSGIVYCATRATAERVADSLSSRGFSARAYHAGLTAAERAENQELFLRDETKIICATIAFGMGINKPNVRWIIHYDLPKNIEGYYQETGRAGRDGLPGDCLLLFSGGDAAKQTHFIDEMTDEHERNRARAQLRQMLHYAETAACRRRELLGYFGENFAAENCGSCDNCLEPRETYDGTIPAQKFLSCVYRVRQASRFGVGINHIVEVLTGADTDKIRRWGHDKLSTYGIGAEMTRPQWAAVGRELLRMGCLAQAEGEFPTLELTAEGMDLLRTRRSVTLTKPLALPKARRVTSRAGASGSRETSGISEGVGAREGGMTSLAFAHGAREGEVACDEILFARLRELRKKLADERGVPAYVIFGDKTLRELARLYPERESDMQGVFGIGEKKREQFGAIFAEAIADFLKTNPRMKFE